MAVENIMYFALGFLVAGLVGIAIGSAIWNRAVRLTRRRIEAATPVTLSEFRADKDKLRAEFAIALRRMELRVEALREKLASRVVALDAASTELAALRTERDEQFEAIGTLQVREQELMVRIRDLERDGAALAARLRQADIDLSDLNVPLMPEASSAISADELSGDYRADVEDLLTALSIERQRNGYLEEQARLLLARLEKKKKGGIKDEAIAMLRDTLASRTDPESEARTELRRAEARIQDAESRLNALLADTGRGDEDEGDRLLAEDLSQDERFAALRADVEGLGEAIIADWQTERFDAAAMRDRLAGIASDVSELVYAADAEDRGALSESLFDKVRKFAADSLDGEELTGRPEGGGGAVSERLAALQGAKTV